MTAVFLSYLSLYICLVYTNLILFEIQYLDYFTEHKEVDSGSSNRETSYILLTEDIPVYREWNVILHYLLVSFQI